MAQPEGKSTTSSYSIQKVFCVTHGEVARAGSDADAATAGGAHLQEFHSDPNGNIAPGAEVQVSWITCIQLETGSQATAAAAAADRHKE